MGRPHRALFSLPLLLLALLFCITPALSHGADRWKEVLGPRGWEFPRDHGAHPAYRTEWWYFTGNLADGKGNRFGYELTFFRQGVSEERIDPGNAWSLRDLYLAHFTITDVGKKRFFVREALSRTGPGLAGASEDRLDTWLLGWSARMDGKRITLRARSGAMALSLALTFRKPPVLNGSDGLSRKGPLPGQASYYVSATDLPTEGTLGLPGGGRVGVRGVSWFDHEFGSGTLSAGQAGWDWFGLHISDGRDLMIYLLRRKDGTVEPESSGTIVDAGGKARHIPLSAIKVDVLDRWKSPKSGAVYPGRWRVEVRGEGIDMTVAPLVAGQELVTGESTGITYWEGAVEGRGTSGGGSAACLGYVELTGYAGALRPLARPYQ